MYFSDIQNSIGQDILQLLLNGESINDVCSKLIYTRGEIPSNEMTLIIADHFVFFYSIDTTDTFYFPSKFHLFITLSKRLWPTENVIYKEFKWIPFKIENDPWNGLLKRHLWRRMIDV